MTASSIKSNLYSTWILLLAILAAGPLSLQAQNGNLTGRVVLFNSKFDKGVENLISGVEVKLADSLIAESDELGFFYFYDLEVNEDDLFEISARKPGYYKTDGIDFYQIIPGVDDTLTIYMASMQGVADKSARILAFSEDAWKQKINKTLASLHSNEERKRVVLKTLAAAFRKSNGFSDATMTGVRENFEEEFLKFNPIAERIALLDMEKLDDSSVEACQALMARNLEEANTVLSNTSIFGRTGFDRSLLKARITAISSDVDVSNGQYQQALSSSFAEYALLAEYLKMHQLFNLASILFEEDLENIVENYQTKLEGAVELVGNFSAQNPELDPQNALWLEAIDDLLSYVDATNESPFALEEQILKYQPLLEAKNETSKSAALSVALARMKSKQSQNEQSLKSKIKPLNAAIGLLEAYHKTGGKDSVFVLPELLDFYEEYITLYSRYDPSALKASGLVMENTAYMTHALTEQDRYDLLFKIASNEERLIPSISDKEEIRNQYTKVISARDSLLRHTTVSDAILEAQIYTYENYINFLIRQKAPKDEIRTNLEKCIGLYEQWIEKDHTIKKVVGQSKLYKMLSDLEEGSSAGLLNLEIAVFGMELAHSQLPDDKSIASNLISYYNLLSWRSIRQQDFRKGQLYADKGLKMKRDEMKLYSLLAISELLLNKASRSLKTIARAEVIAEQSGDDFKGIMLRDLNFLETAGTIPLTIGGEVEKIR